MTAWPRIRRLAGAATVTMLLLVQPTVAQETTTTPAADEGGFDPAFSTTVIRELGLPEVTVSAGPDGVSAPDTLPAGLTLVTVEAPRPFITYAAIVQPPEGLAEDEATDLALAAAQADLAQPDWLYYGGTNTPGGGASTSFAIDLAPGEYRWAISWYGPDPGSEEIMTLLPLNVTGSSDLAAIPAAVELAAVDGLQFTISPEVVFAGPAIWRFSNLSDATPAQHHAVLWQIPEGATADQLVQEFNALVSGTPAAGEPVLDSMTWVGYFALQSPGATTWAEFDLAPGRYAVTSFVVDPETQRPQVLDGMATVFEVGG